MQQARQPIDLLLRTALGGRADAAPNCYPPPAPMRSENDSRQKHAATERCSSHRPMRPLPPKSWTPAAVSENSRSVRSCPKSRHPSTRQILTLKPGNPSGIFRRSDRAGPYPAQASVVGFGPARVRVAISASASLRCGADLAESASSLAGRCGPPAPRRSPQHAAASRRRHRSRGSPASACAWARHSSQ